jgi:hypothetical protein
MPLAATDLPGLEDDDGVRFPMADGLITVVVLVTREVLDAMENPPPGAGGYVERLQQHRYKFEDIASIKYDGGRREPDGSICITSADLA